MHITDQSEPAYRAAVEGELEPSLGHWLRLVRWIRVTPHAIVLAFLWIALFFLAIIALFVGAAAPVPEARSDPNHLSVRPLAAA